jgi:hypothetical protein
MEAKYRRIKGIERGLNDRPIRKFNQHNPIKAQKIKVSYLGVKFSLNYFLTP